MHGAIWPIVAVSNRLPLSLISNTMEHIQRHKPICHTLHRCTTNNSSHSYNKLFYQKNGFWVKKLCIGNSVVSTRGREFIVKLIFGLQTRFLLGEKRIYWLILIIHYYLRRKSTCMFRTYNGFSLQDFQVTWANILFLIRTLLTNRSWSWCRWRFAI